jgi:alkylation response protein AidB-like acyl-CoA dehydrogenase
MATALATRAAEPVSQGDQHRSSAGAPRPVGAESVLTARRLTGRLPAEAVRWSTTTQIYEGTNQIQRVVMARQILK